MDCENFTVVVWTALNYLSCNFHKKNSFKYIDFFLGFFFELNYYIDIFGLRLYFVMY